MMMFMRVFLSGRSNGIIWNKARVTNVRLMLLS